MADSEVLRRNGLSQKRKTRNALAVLNGMVETGEVEKLWRDFHTNLKAARETVCYLFGVGIEGRATNLSFLVYLVMNMALKRHCIFYQVTNCPCFHLCTIPPSVISAAPLYIASSTQWIATLRCQINCIQAPSYTSIFYIEQPLFLGSYAQVGRHSGIIHVEILQAYFARLYSVNKPHAYFQHSFLSPSFNHK